MKVGLFMAENQMFLHLIVISVNKGSHIYVGISFVKVKDKIILVRELTRGRAEVFIYLEE